VELDYSLSKQSRYLHLAARFAAKEAVAKALGRSFAWKDVELVNNSNGKPLVNLYGEAKSAANGAMVHVSLSHSDNYACAVAVVET
jgi:holo-[acyl-carrier protein] synthase